MRNQITVLSLILTLTFGFGSVAQAQSIDLSGNADCEGWSSMVSLTFPAGVYTEFLSYSMVLTDQAGVELSRFDHNQQLYRFDDPVMMMMYGSSWNFELDSAYVVRLELNFMNEAASLTFDLACAEEEEEPNLCRFTSGFWKNNPEMWPVDALNIGGVEFSKDQLVEMMMAPIRGSGRLLMTRDLIAAKLNVANGCENLINKVIVQGDLYLITNPVFENIHCSSMSSTRVLRQELQAYNSVGCDELSFDTDGGNSDLQFKAEAIEQTSFSSLKAMYR